MVGLESAADASGDDFAAPVAPAQQASPAPKPDKSFSLWRALGVLLIILVLGAAGVVAYAYVETGSPDPLPVVQPWFDQYIEPLLRDLQARMG